MKTHSPSNNQISKKMDYYRAMITGELQTGVRFVGSKKDLTNIAKRLSEFFNNERDITYRYTGDNSLEAKFSANA